MQRGSTHTDSAKRAIRRAKALRRKLFIAAIPTRIVVNKRGCHIWQGVIGVGGYGYVTIQRKGWRVHRWVWTQRYGKIPKGLCVCHKCDTPACINIGHLFLGTQADNVADRVKKGRTAVRVGAEQWKAKLTEQQVRRIRVDRRSQRAIARDYGLTQGWVSNIKNRKAWRHVK